MPRTKADWPLLVILALAFLLRMGWPTLAEFKLDESLVARRALAIAYEGARPAVGAIASVGTYHPPLNLYLMALPLRLWPDPVAAVLFVGLLNGLAVWGCYALGKTYFGREVGLIAAFLFAVNPWAVSYGRKIWSQNLPLVTVGFFAALFAVFVRGRQWALTGAFVALAALIGLHLGGLAFVPVLLIASLAYREQVRRRPLMLGSLAALLLLSPYWVHDALHNWPKLRGFLRYVGGEAHFSWDALRYAFANAGGDGFHALAGSLYRAYLGGLPNLWWLNGLMSALLAAALVYGVVLAVRGPRPQRRGLVLLLLWFLVPVALQSRPTTPVYRFYFILLYPVQFLLVAILLRRVMAAGRRRRAAVPLFLALWGLWQTAVVGQMLWFMTVHPTTGGYGIPLRYRRAAALEARRLAAGDEVLVLSTGVNPSEEETPAAFEALLFGRRHRFADGRWALPVPDSRRAVYLVGPLPLADDGDLRPAVAQLEGWEHVQPGPVVAMADGWGYRLFLRESDDREDVLSPLTRFPGAGIAFTNGVVFMGYALPGEASPGSALEVRLAWWLRQEVPDGAQYHFYVHLVDAAGRLRSQHDGSGFPTASWRPGDLVLSRFLLPLPADLPPGRYTAVAGMYTYPAVEGVSYLDAAGNPAGQMVTLGTVSVGGR